MRGGREACGGFRKQKDTNAVAPDLPLVRIAGSANRNRKIVTIHTPWMGVKCNVPTHDGSVTGAEN